MSHQEEGLSKEESLMDGALVEDTPHLQPKLITNGSHQERIVFPAKKNATGVLVIE